jgi:K+-transporting ATPase ATPase C chain
MTAQTAHTSQDSVGKLLWTCTKVFVGLTVITGLAYPLVVTGISQLVFPQAANGSLIVENGQVKGSSLIGQPFSDARHFWSRLSAASDHPYNGLGSGGSNLGPSNPALKDEVAGQAAALRKLDPDNQAPVPEDLVTSSASGLDPHISPAAALWQANRVAKANNLPVDKMKALIDEHTEGRSLFGLLGEPRVNVLELNLALDRLAKAK